MVRGTCAFVPATRAPGCLTGNAPSASIDPALGAVLSQLFPVQRSSNEQARSGGFTGRSGQRRAFVHIYLAEERAVGVSRPVWLFAWGDDELVEAVVLADTPENRDVFRKTFEADVEEAIALVRTLAQTADDVIRGITRMSNYYGDVNPASP